MRTPAGEGGGSGGAVPQPGIIYAATARPAPTRVSTAVVRKQRRTAARRTKAVRDTSGTTLVANDKSGFGLSRPYLGWNTYPTTQETTPAQSTGSGSFVSLVTVSAEPQHPKIRVRFRAVTGAATAGEVRLIDRVTGQVIAGPTVVGTATSLEADLDGSLVGPVLAGAGAPMRVDLQARITSGASTISVLVMHALGKGT